MNMKVDKHGTAGDRRNCICIFYLKSDMTDGRYE